MFNRRSLIRSASVWLLILASLLAVYSLPGCRKADTAAPAGPGSASKVRLQLDWFPQTEYGGYFQALGRGFYQDVGLEVEIVSGGPGVPVKETVALGRVEVGCTDGNDVIVAISRGLPLVIVGAEMQRNPQGILYHQSHPLRSFADLNGRSFMAGPGSAWVEYLSKTQGVKFGLVPLTTDLTSFLGDATMVRQCFVTQEPYFAAQSGAKVGTLLIADSGYAPYRVLYTSRDYLAKHRETVRHFVAATARGFDDMIDGDPATAFGALGKANPLMTPGVMSYSLGAMKSLGLVQGRADQGERTGLITRERIAAQLKILTELGQLTKPLTVDDVAVFDLVPAPKSTGDTATR